MLKKSDLPQKICIVLQQAFQLAAQMGKSLGRGKVLQ